MFTIRKYTEVDYETIKSWWEVSRGYSPLGSIMPRDSSYILETDGEPTLAGSLYYSNAETFCMIDNFVGNPDLAGADRRTATQVFMQYAEKLAKERGYRRLFCMTAESDLVDYYTQLGFNVTGQTLTTLTKEL